MKNCHSTCPPVLYNGQLGFGAPKKFPWDWTLYLCKKFSFLPRNLHSFLPRVWKRSQYTDNGHFSVSRADNCHDHISSTPLYEHWLPSHCLFLLSQSCANCRYCTQQKCVKGLTSVFLLLVHPCSKTPKQVFWILVHKVLLPCLYAEVSIFAHTFLRLWLF